jgi:hypothetical protein
MKQTLHIFAKDVRHFLPEILVSLAITVAFAWVYPSQWLQESVGAVAGGSFLVRQELAALAACLALLVPVSWWLLISRLIHAENLVGECQFWITRPYEWKTLLAAKLLFLASFLYLPLVLAQCFLLMRAGFHPFSYIPGLLLNLLLISAVLVLPLFVVATVTSSFARMTLVIIGALLCLIALIAFSSAIDHISILNPLPDRFSLPLLFCGCAAIVALQYRARRTSLARVLLIALVVVIWAGASVVPNDILIRRAYPRTNNTPTPSLHFSPGDDSLHQPATYKTRSSKRIGIMLPFRISGIADGYAWSPDNVSVSIEGPQGIRWSSPWQSMYSARYLPGEQDVFVRFEMSRAIFDQVKSTPVTLHLTFAWTQLRSGAVQRIALPTHDFVVPGFGVCSPVIDLTAPTQIAFVSCRTALRQPRLTYVDTRWSEDPCSASSSTAGVEGSGWTGTVETAPAELSIPSVRVTPLPLSNNWNYNPDRPIKPRHLCPGTPLTFTEYTVMQRTQSDVTISNFRFPPVTVPNVSGTSLGLDVSPR